MGFLPSTSRSNPLQSDSGHFFWHYRLCARDWRPHSCYGIKWWWGAPHCLWLTFLLVQSTENDCRPWCKHIHALSGQCLCCKMGVRHLNFFHNNFDRLDYLHDLRVWSGLVEKETSLRRPIMGRFKTQAARKICWDCRFREVRKNQEIPEIGKANAHRQELLI